MQVFRRPLIFSQTPYKLNLVRFSIFPGRHPFSFKPRDVSFFSFTSSAYLMSSARRPGAVSPTYSSDSPLKPSTPSFTAFSSPDTDHMLFGPLEFDDYVPPPHVSWDTFHDMDPDVKPRFDFAPSLSTYDYDMPQMSPTDSGFFDAAPVDINLVKSSPPIDNFFLANWINDPELSLSSSPSSPIPIPSPVPPLSPSFVAYTDQAHFPRSATFSPTEFAALHSLARSISPPSSFEERSPIPRQRVHSISPLDTRLHAPSWASQLFDTSNSLHTPSSSRSAVRHSPFSDTTMRQRIPVRRGSIPSSHLFQSSSAPSVYEPRTPLMTRSYARRAESESVNDDQDPTARRKKRSPPVEDPSSAPRPNDSRQCFIIALSPFGP